MAVLLTVSETLNGSAIADILEGPDPLEGGGTGIDLGAVVNNQYAPFTAPKGDNLGAQTLYIRHNANDFPITDVGFFIQEYGVGTGFTYGGADSAANDIATLISLGTFSGSSKNNADGMSGGLWIDMDSDVSTTNQFDHAGFPGVVKIFGDNGTDGINLASAFELQSAAMVYDSGGETQATSPVNGQIGIANDSGLGDNAKIKLRIYLPNTFTDGGYVQCEIVCKYSYTS
jgi:hypothetical protein